MNHQLKLFAFTVLSCIIFANCKTEEESIKPTAKFTVVKNNSRAGEPIQIINYSENAESYLWDFGDGNTSIDETPNYNYSSPGEFKIILKAIHGNQEDTASQHIVLIGYSDIYVSTDILRILGPDSASCWGIVSNMSNKEITNKGIYWSKTTKPSSDNYIGYTSEGTSNSDFKSYMSNLEANTKYFVKTYISTADEIIYGEELEFITPPEDNLTPIATITKTKIVPIVDGIKDEIWNSVAKNIIQVPVEDNLVSFKESASWRALWDDNYLYLLIEVPDDDFYPSVESNLDFYLSDCPEIFIDVNENKVDGFGVMEGPSSGHHGYAPSFNDENHKTDFYPNCSFAYDANIDKNDNSTSYFVEYAFLFEDLTDNDGDALNPTDRNTIGLDILINDLDEIGKGESSEIVQRVSWVNDGQNAYSGWDNMDWSGDLIFEY